MARNRKVAWQMLLLGCAAVIVAGWAWLVLRSASGGGKPAAEGLVRVDMPATAARTSPIAAPVAMANLPALPDRVIAHVRQDYPLLTEVDFRCDAGGCAVTATIPPPTDDAFLKQRQEMLLGGLARTVAADGYTMLGPVRMDEVAFNVFHIRASVTPAQGQEQARQDARDREPSGASPKRAPRQAGRPSGTGSGVDPDRHRDVCRRNCRVQVASARRPCGRARRA